MATTGPDKAPFSDLSAGPNPLRRFFDKPPARVTLRIADLDLENGPYCTSFGRPLKPLASSMQRVGLLNPPLVHRGQGEAWDVVCGFQRLRALLEMGEETCPCLELSTPHPGPVELLLMGVYDNLTTRGLNEVEKGRVLERLAAYLDETTVLRDGMALLGLPSRASVLSSYRALVGAEAMVQQAVASGLLSMKAFCLLKRWPSPDRTEACDWVTNLRMNFNKQYQFVELLDDISIEEQITPQGLLQLDSIRSVLAQEGVNRPQKTVRVLETLRKRRFPKLEAAERAFRKQVSSLELPKGVRVVHPPGFEGSDFRLEVVFRNGSDLRKRLETLFQTQGLKALNAPRGNEGEGA